MEVTQLDIDYINLVITNEDQYDKITTKKLQEIALKIWPEDFVYTNIFDKKDTCLCSANMRKTYKARFINQYNIILKLGDGILL
jgi:hypothetical protein